MPIISMFFGKSYACSMMNIIPLIYMLNFKPEKKGGDIYKVP